PLVWVESNGRHPVLTLPQQYVQLHPRAPVEKLQHAGRPLYPGPSAPPVPEAGHEEWATGTHRQGPDDPVPARDAARLVARLSIPQKDVGITAAADAPTPAAGERKANPPTLVAAEDAPEARPQRVGRRPQRAAPDKPRLPSLLPPPPRLHPA